MAIVLISMKVCLIVSFGILNFSSKVFIEEVCVVALAPVVMTISGSTFHPLLVMLSISDWYFQFYELWFLIIYHLLTMHIRFYYRSYKCMDLSPDLMLSMAIFMNSSVHCPRLGPFALVFFPTLDLEYSALGFGASTR